MRRFISLFTAKTPRTPRKWVNSFITYVHGNFAADLRSPATKFMGAACLKRRLQQIEPQCTVHLSMASTSCSISSVVLFVSFSLRALGVFAVRNGIRSMCFEREIVLVSIVRSQTTLIVG
jgi:hypothetical protein